MFPPRKRGGLGWGYSIFHLIEKPHKRLIRAKAQLQT
jgi:hypothetical protein